MFYVVSKTLGLLLSPANLCMLLVALALLLRLVRRAPRARRWLAIGGVVQLLLFASGAVSNALLTPLERDYHQPRPAPAEVGAIVVLSGMLMVSPDGIDVSDAGDRFIASVALAHRYPRAKLLVSGGVTYQSALGRHNEAEVLARMARESGIAPERVLVDNAARNTRENATLSKPLLRDIRGAILLVTSALHMPRAVACFAKVGLQVVPWPVDHRWRALRDIKWVPAVRNLADSGAALHEYVGLLSYRLAGYI